MMQTKWARWMSLLSAKQLLGLAILALYILIALLAPILRRLKEGFDSADAVRARALLETVPA